MVDPFGRAVWEYYSGEGDGEYVVEQATGGEETNNAAMFFTGYEEWEDVTKRAMEAVRGGGRVLDVGCGSGRHSLWLQSNGHEVIATDRSRLAVETARERGVGNCVAMSFSELSFARDSFDTVLIIGNMLGVSGEISAIEDQLTELDRITTADGRVVLDNQDVFAGGTVDADHLDPLSRHEAARATFRLKYDGLVGDWKTWLLVGKEELADLVEPTAWTVAEVLEPDDVEEYSRIGSGWYYAVLEKE